MEYRADGEQMTIKVKAEALQKMARQQHQSLVLIEQKVLETTKTQGASYIL